MEQLPSHLVPLTRFAAMTGWRKGECLSLQWRQVDFKAGVVRLEPGTTKNKEGRVWPFAKMPALDAPLREQHEWTRALERSQGRIISWVFHESGEPIRDFRREWVAACEAAKVARMFHDLRRTAVRSLERAGVARSVATQLTGHKTESVFRRYAIVSERDLREGVDKLAAPGTSTGRSQTAAKSLS